MTVNDYHPSWQAILIRKSMPYLLAAAMLVASFGLSCGKKEKIAFVSDSKNQTLPEICTMNSDGTGLRILTKEEVCVFNYDPIWSPDGKNIVFVSTRHYGRQIYTMNSDGSKQKWLVDPGEGDAWLHAPWLSEAENPLFSPDGKKIAFTTSWSEEIASTEWPWEEHVDLYVMNLDSGNAKRLTEIPEDYGVEEAPTSFSWSPDSKNIVCVLAKGDANRDGIIWDPDYELYIINVDDGSLRRLTHNNTVDTCPSWSPDGKYIAFMRGFADSPQWGGRILYIIDLNSGEETRLTETLPIEEGEEYISWSPDGKKMAVTGLICTINTDGRIIEELACGYHPSWSPDGKRIAFASKSQMNGDTEIYIMNANGTELKQLTFNEVDDYDPVWQPMPEKVRK